MKIANSRYIKTILGIGFIILCTSCAPQKGILEGKKGFIDKNHSGILQDQKHPGTYSTPFIFSSIYPGGDKDSGGAKGILLPQKKQVGAPIGQGIFQKSPVKAFIPVKPLI